jgi:tRNA threonylcarbamoyladenosine biosynthesis protein TsaE
MFTSRSPEDTRQLGLRWADELLPGSTVGLSGDLGAGKTQLVKGLAEGLGFQGRVHSPTFALMNEYAGGRVPIFHLDLYRLADAEQARGAGLEEFVLNPAGITVVEWYDRWEAGGNMPPVLRRVWIEILEASQRHIRHEDTRS